MCLLFRFRCSSWHLWLSRTGTLVVERALYQALEFHILLEARCMGEPEKLESATVVPSVIDAPELKFRKCQFLRQLGYNGSSIPCDRKPVSAMQAKHGAFTGFSSVLHSLLPYRYYANLLKGTPKANIKSMHTLEIPFLKCQSACFVPKKKNA